MKNKFDRISTYITYFPEIISDYARSEALKLTSPEQKLNDARNELLRFLSQLATGFEDVDRLFNEVANINFKQMNTIEVLINATKLRNTYTILNESYPKPSQEELFQQNRLIMLKHFLGFPDPKLFVNTGDVFNLNTSRLMYASCKSLSFVAKSDVRYNKNSKELNSRITKSNFDIYRAINYRTHLISFT